MLNGSLNLDPIKGEKIKLNLAGAMRDELKLGLNLSGPVRAQLDAAAQPVAGLPLSLKLTSPQLRWPLTGPVQYQADNLDYQFGGKATDYVMSLRTAVKGEAVPPPLRWTVKATCSSSVWINCVWRRCRATLT